MEKKNKNSILASAGLLVLTQCGWPILRAEVAGLVIVVAAGGNGGHRRQCWVGVDVVMLTTIQANVSDRVCTTGTHLSCGVLGVLEVRVVAVIDISGGGGLSTSTLGAEIGRAHV